MDSREAMKAFACDFFYWWYNQPGSNTRAGFDDFAETDAGKLRIIGLEAALSHQTESAEPVGDLLGEDPVAVLGVFCGYAREPLEAKGVPSGQIIDWFHGLKRALTARQPAAVPEVWREALLAEFPLVEEDGLDQVAHHCEWALLQDRKRLHALLAAPQPPKEGE